MRKQINATSYRTNRNASIVLEVPRRCRRNNCNDQLKQQFRINTLQLLCYGVVTMLNFVDGNQFATKHENMVLQLVVSYARVMKYVHARIEHQCARTSSRSASALICERVNLQFEFTSVDTRDINPQTTNIQIHDHTI